MAFSNVGVALVHALEYPVGGAVHCSHGGGNGLLLPVSVICATTCRHAEEGIRDRRSTVGRGRYRTERGNDAAERARLLRLIGCGQDASDVPGKLRDLGVKEEAAAARLRGEGVRDQTAHTRQPLGRQSSYKRTWKWILRGRGEALTEESLAVSFTRM